MKSRVLAASAAIAVVLLGLTTHAHSSGFSWNRRALGLTTQPASGGTHDIVFTWSFEFDGAGELDDLGTEAEFSWGTAPVAPGSPECIIWDIKDSCTHACTATDSCGTSVVDGVPTTLTCGTGDGLCHGPELVGVIPSVPLEVGDVISVTLSPAKGAAAEGDTSDDSLTIVFGPTTVEPRSWGAVKDGYR